MVWSENFHFKPFPDSRAKRERDRTQREIKPRAQSPSTLHPSTSPFDSDFESHPSTSPANPEPRSCLRLRRDRTPRLYRDGTDCTEITIEKWLGFDGFDRVFWLAFVSVFIYWEMVLYICLEVEKIWENVRNKKKMCFLYYFQQHNQTLENIFQNIFWNATKHLKKFSFPENNISGKYLFSIKYFTWPKHNLTFWILLIYKFYLFILSLI